jgi:hypothetical protein
VCTLARHTPRSKWPMVSGRVVGVYGLEMGLPSGPSISSVRQLQGASPVSAHAPPDQAKY